MKQYDSAKGWGFARLADGNDAFVHRTCLEAAGIASLERGDRVEIEAESTPRGMRAVSIRLLP